VRDGEVLEGKPGGELVMDYTEADGTQHGGTDDGVGVSVERQSLGD
jgi:hypothetical protein